MSQPLLITPGEPAGIGPDVVLQSMAPGMPCKAVVVADKQLLEDRAQQLNLSVEFQPVHPEDFTQLPKAAPGVIYVWHHSLQATCLAGQLNVANANYVLDTLTSATNYCLANPETAVVTGPVHKGIINDAGRSFSGHTEFLRDKAGVDEVVMMLATEGLRVALVTTHLPLRDVADAITQPKITRVCRILNDALHKDFGIKTPNILVTGLNPHAGEGGHLGREEIEVITPALNELRSDGLHLQGPLPADTLFQPHYLDQADAVLAMYHDQGLPVLKFKGFNRAVNITLGLPFIRTSVDHGTALDLAGTGQAHSGSFQVAIETAADMMHHRGLSNA